MSLKITPPIASLLLMLFISLGCLAQETKPPIPKRVETDPQTWKVYSSEVGGFSILFPDDPAMEQQLIDAAPNVQFKLEICRYKKLAEYSVMYADYPIPVGDPAVAKSVLDNGAKGAVASMNSELLDYKEIELDGRPGRYLKERMTGGEIMYAKMLLVGQRMFQIAITMPRDRDVSVETIKLFEPIPEKFLSSFKLLKKD